MAKLSGSARQVGPDGGPYRVFRGGSWRCHPGGCRSAYRSYFRPSFRIDGLSFRVARSQSAQ